jgi:hypothetical protein
MPQNDDPPREDERLEQGVTMDAPKPNDPMATLQSQQMTQDTLTFEGKQLVLRWPATLSAEQFADLEAWVNIALRRTARENKLKTQGAPAAF